MKASDILSKINSAMEGSGIECKLQRRVRGEYFRDATEKDMAEADLSAVCRSAAEELKVVSR